mmetsp:Transcript_41866/g.90839  ORF Transcript_41866/g.90839 Transcript_41866/m.90839 type:complete len:163 (+) Transcript_41866:381-869(+)
MHVVFCELTLSLVSLDVGVWLIVNFGGEDLAAFDRDDGVTGYDLGHDTTHSLHTQRQRCHIQQNQVAPTSRHQLELLSCEDSGLHSGTICNGLVRVDAVVKLFAVEEVFEQSLNFGDASGATDENNLVDFAARHPSVTKNVLNWNHRLLEQVQAELFELCSC